MKKASIPAILVVASLVVIALTIGVAIITNISDGLEMVKSPRSVATTPYPYIKLSIDNCVATVTYDDYLELGGTTPNVLYYRNQNSWPLGSNASGPYHWWDYDWELKVCNVRYISLDKPYAEDLRCNGTVYSTQFNGYRTYAKEGGMNRDSPPAIGGTGSFGVIWEGKLKRSVKPECYSLIDTIVDEFTGDTQVPPEIIQPPINQQSLWEKLWGWIIWVLGF